MLRRSLALISLASLLSLLSARDGSAACLNKFVSRAEGGMKVVTLLTGKLTFDEAKALAAAINAGHSPPMLWLSDSGRAVATQIGQVKVVRPMPVGCDGRASGVVLVLNFMSPNTPHGKVTMKLDSNNPVEFEEQAN
jgi:hypothetical protein